MQAASRPARLPRETKVAGKKVSVATGIPFIAAVSFVFHVLPNASLDLTVSLRCCVERKPNAIQFLRTTLGLAIEGGLSISTHTNMISFLESCLIRLEP